MHRRIFSLVSLLSLVVCVATMAVWGFQTGASQPGEMQFGNANALGGMTINREGWYYTHTVSGTFPDLRDRDWGGIGVTVLHTFGHVPQYVVVQLPHWFVAGAALILPAAWLAKRKLSKRKPGLCPACGYNLTGNTSGKCPECGTEVKTGV